ncbi:unnamed protein product, partial [marine sediment metagenome]
VPELPEVAPIKTTTRGGTILNMSRLLILQVY